MKNVTFFAFNECKAAYDLINMKLETGLSFLGLK